MRRALVLLLAIALFTGCAFGRSAARSAPAVADDVLSTIRKLPIDDLAAGATTGLDDTLRANPALREAIEAAAFRAAVAESAVVAEAQVRSGVQRWFGRLDEFAQARVESKFKTMICEARFYALNPAGDVEALRPWVSQELTEVGVQLDELGLSEVTTWLTDQISDATSTYSLACFTWLRISG